MYEDSVVSFVYHRYRTILEIYILADLLNHNVEIYRTFRIFLRSDAICTQELIWQFTSQEWSFKNLALILSGVVQRLVNIKLYIPLIQQLT